MGFWGGDSVFGASFGSWDLVTRNETTNNTYTNKETYLNKDDILTLKNHLQTIMGKLIYTDETWVNACNANEYKCADSDGKGGWKVSSGKGQRLIVVHAGGVEGWVEGAGLVFRSKTNFADYHDKMTSEHNMEWLTE